MPKTSEMRSSKYYAREDVGAGALLTIPEGHQGKRGDGR